MLFSKQRHKPASDVHLKQNHEKCSLIIYGNDLSQVFKISSCRLFLWNFSFPHLRLLPLTTTMSDKQFRSAIRFLARHKGYTGINILGLTLGLCACLVIYNIVSYEFSFDRSWPDCDRIYRMSQSPPQIVLVAPLNRALKDISLLEILESN
jgi:hypothetical protein